MILVCFGLVLIWFSYAFGMALYGFGMVLVWLWFAFGMDF